MRKVRKYNLIILGLLLSSMALSQETHESISKHRIRKNSVDLTLGGSGLFISANYGRIIMVEPNYFLNASVGIGTVIMIGGVSIPHQLTFNFGKKSSFLELGLGGTF